MKHHMGVDSSQESKLSCEATEDGYKSCQDFEVDKVRVEYSFTYRLVKETVCFFIVDVVVDDRTHHHFYHYISLLSFIIVD